MSLIEKLAAPTPHRPAGKSIIDVWVETRPTEEQTAIRTAAANPMWGHTALLKELVSEGCPSVSTNALRQWRRKQGLES